MYARSGRPIFEPHAPLWRRLRSMTNVLALFFLPFFFPEAFFSSSFPTVTMGSITAPHHSDPRVLWSFRFRRSMAEWALRKVSLA
ncbi:hypothetical protein LMH87_000794 [Akanthomyces muscarius]|uniref:Uncharacterized protein n=1 Tax=Akanthomyces muscarius TaxID=2231603 RepID=A0A9W8UP72_AKAMU|nr:hypothetical protein LMH87_000794 [Akanthomyces muscarius]KAJ4155555.1 hypothetical protein LMH87_000794 [Akanthomyces muscarius]